MVCPPVVLLWHLVTCVLVAWGFHRWGHRMWRAHPGFMGLEDRWSAIPRTIVIAAWVSLAWVVVADLAHLMWFLPTVASGNHGPVWNLALGRAGVGGIWLGAIVLHVLTIVWLFRRRMRSSIRRVGDLSGICQKCGYPRPAGSVCPECGVRGPEASRFSSAPRGIGAGRTASACVLAIVLMGLFAAPLTLAIGGRVVGMKNADAIATWWYRLLPPQ
jgi:hypothetical protein